jgi:transcriptional regulator with XRE-family HTH domain
LVLKQQLPWRLVRLRELHGLSENKIAKLSGVCTSRLNEIGGGLAKDIKYSTLMKLCGVLHVTPAYLLGGASGDYAEPIDIRQLIKAHKWNAEPWLCSSCARVIPGNHPHLLGECIVMLYDQGKSREYLATFWGLSVGSIAKIIEDEYDIRRRRLRSPIRAIQPG